MTLTIDDTTDTKREPKPRKKADLSEREIVQRLITKIGKRLVSSKEDVGTIGDLIRLMQIKKDFKADGAKEIKVTWIDPKEKTSSSEQ